MSKADKLKEEIGWLKVVFALLVATDISLMAWLAHNYAKADLLLSASCALAVVVVMGAVVWINHTAYAKIDELEDL
jgi:hypothetical protein